MSSDEPPSAFAAIFGAVLAGAALIGTGWIAMRGRQDGGLGMPARRPLRERPAAAGADAADEVATADGEERS